jgi:hypothetical protein
METGSVVMEVEAVSELLFASARAPDPCLDASPASLGVLVPSVALIAVRSLLPL